MFKIEKSLGVLTIPNDNYTNKLHPSLNSEVCAFIDDLLNLENGDIIRVVRNPKDALKDNPVIISQPHYTSIVGSNQGKEIGDGISNDTYVRLQKEQMTSYYYKKEGLILKVDLPDNCRIVYFPQKSLPKNNITNQLEVDSVFVIPAECLGTIPYFAQGSGDAGANSYKNRFIFNVEIEIGGYNSRFNNYNSDFVLLYYLFNKDTLGGVFLQNYSSEYTYNLSIKKKNYNDIVDKSEKYIFSVVDEIINKTNSNDLSIINSLLSTDITKESKIRSVNSLMSIPDEVFNTTVNILKTPKDIISKLNDIENIVNESKDLLYQKAKILGDLQNVIVYKGQAYRTPSYISRLTDSSLKNILTLSEDNIIGKLEDYFGQDKKVYQVEKKIRKNKVEIEGNEVAVV